MNYERFTTRRCRLFLILALALIWIFPPLSQAQQSSQNATPSASKDSPAAAPKVSTEDSSVLTREYALVQKERPKVVVQAALPSAVTFTRELYRVEWRAKDPFDLYVIRPKGVAKPPVILYLPSYPEDTDVFKNNDWCDMAVQRGYAAVGFVGAVTGHRMRYRLMKEWFVSEMPEALTSTTHDVQLILDYLTTRGDLDMDHVAMFGNGSGASIAILASVVDPRIKVLDLQAPWGDWKTWLSESKAIPEDERAKYLKPEFVASVAPLDPVTWLPKIQAKSVRIEDIRGNKAMPNEAQEKLEAAAPDFAVINQYGNGRAFLATQHPITFLEWVKAQLQPDAKPQVAMEKSARIHFFPALQPPPGPDGIQKLANLKTPQAAKAPDGTKDKEKEKENPR
jgi:hypothetical protein